MIVRNEEAGRWTAVDHRDRFGVLRVLVRPDQRAVVLLSAVDERARAALLDTVVAEHRGDLYASVAEDDLDAVAEFSTRGFRPHRREHNYLVPTDPARTRLPATLPSGYDLRPVTEADPDRWRQLDDTLRVDVPGADGWRNDPARFIADTFADPEFDPELYLIAVAAPDEYAGLVRVWSRPERPRLGLIGTVRDHRRRGLAGALLGHVFAILHDRGQPDVECEIDEHNAASTALFTGLGAVRTGSTLELRRPGRTA